MSLFFIVADYDNPQHAEAIVSLLDAYASDPMGGAAPLGEFTRDNLVAALAGTPGAFSVLGFKDDRAVALANCFQSLSTFTCKPLINIHDLVVDSDYRGQGISQTLLAYIEAEALGKRCCKITLEVLEGNPSAQAAYTKFGFEDYRLGKQTGRALFMQKRLMMG